MSLNPEFRFRSSHFGIKYQLRFKDDEAAAKAHNLVHFPTLIRFAFVILFCLGLDLCVKFPLSSHRLAEASQLLLVDVLNWEDVYEDSR